jgi:hypothetical protein
MANALAVGVITFEPFVRRSKNLRCVPLMHRVGNFFAPSANTQFSFHLRANSGISRDQSCSAFCLREIWRWLLNILTLEIAAACVSGFFLRVCLLLLSHKSVAERHHTKSCGNISLRESMKKGVSFFVSSFGTPGMIRHP